MTDSSTPNATPGKTSAPSSKRLTPAQWQEAKALWAVGEVTLEELARRYGVTKTALSRRFKRYGITKGQDIELAEEEVRRRLLDANRKQTNDLIRLAMESKVTSVKGALNLQKRLLMEFAIATRDNKPLSAIHGNIRAIKDALISLREGSTVVATAVGDAFKDTESDDLPDLPIREMTDLDVEMLRRQQREEDELINGSGLLSNERGLDDEGDDLDEDIEVVEVG